MEITLGHTYRWHATTEKNIAGMQLYIDILIEKYQYESKTLANEYDSIDIMMLKGSYCNNKFCRWLIITSNSKNKVNKVFAKLFYVCVHKKLWAMSQQTLPCTPLPVFISFV